MSPIWGNNVAVCIGDVYCVPTIMASRFGWVPLLVYSYQILIYSQYLDHSSTFPSVKERLKTPIYYRGKAGCIPYFKKPWLLPLPLSWVSTRYSVSRLSIHHPAMAYLGPGDIWDAYVRWWKECGRGPGDQYQRYFNIQINHRFSNWHGWWEWGNNHDGIRAIQIP